MNDDYTPTTITVRRGYYSCSNAPEREERLAAEFDRWLAEHDAQKAKEVRNTTLEEAAVITQDFWDHFMTPNLHQQASQIATTIRAVKAKNESN